MASGRQSTGVSLGPAQMDDIRCQDNVHSISYTTREGTIIWLSKAYQDIFFLAHLEVFYST